MRLSLLAFALLLAASLPTPGQSATQTFRGTIGSQPVVVKLQREGGKLTGSYVYERIGQSLTLAGQIDAQGNVTLAEFDAAHRPTGKFTGKLASDADRADLTLAGTWTRPDGTREQSFNLAEQHVAFTNPAVQFTSKTIADRRLHINATYPQLAGTNAPGALAFNRTAAAKATKLVTDFRKGVSPSDHVALETDYSVLLATDDLISVELSDYVDFGGAHPNDGYDALNYDLRTGRTLALAALFQPGAKYEPVLRRASLASWAAQQRKLAAENGTQPDDEPIMSEDNYEQWLAWGLTPRGLVLYYDLPHVIAVFDKVFIPWTELQSVLDPKGPAGRFIQPVGRR
ncbi:MAG TPA: hypothetical protein VF525_11435 [Pyrinomonadaceae bacterium]|jgi:hypothetical protein